MAPLTTPLVLLPLLILSTLLSALHIPFHQPPPTHNLLASRSEEINAPARKFNTVPDADMPPPIDFNVLARENLSSWDDETLTLTSRRFLPGDYRARLPVANGYVGVTVASAGPFFEVDVNQTNRPGPESMVTEGWPIKDRRQTFSTVSGFFDCQPNATGTNYPELLELGCESVISGIPHPLALNLVAGEHVLNSTVDSATISNFVLPLCFKDGTYQWSYTWSPIDTSVSFDIEYTAFLSRVRANVGAVQLKVTPRGGDYDASIVDVIDGRGAKRSFVGEKGMSWDRPSIYVSNHPDGLPYVTAWTVSTTNVSDGYTMASSRKMMTTTPGDENDDGNNMTIAQQWDVQLIDGKTATFQKFIGVASSDKFDPEPGMEAAMASYTAADDGWDTILSEHKAAWNELMQPNLMTSYRDPVTGKLPENDEIIEKLQIISVADRYFILQNLLPEDGKGLNDNGVSVGGLTADAYGGMIFWDQDIWIYPGIAITNPEYARQILNKRVKLLKQSKANAQMDYVQKKYNFDEESAIYSWTSGRFGNATATGPALDYEYHVNTGIALAMFQDLGITGNETHFRQEFWPVVKAVGHSMTTLLERNGAGWSIRNMTDPDEYSAYVDDGAYTLASIATVLHKIIDFQRKEGLAVNETWVHMSNNVNIPRAPSGITKEFDGMRNDITIKQADVTMLTYPLHWTGNYTLDNKRMDIAYYTQKETPDGPAMTSAINAIGENLVASEGCASFTYNLQARLSNFRAPWYQMSEQANDDVNANGGIPPAFLFLTGHGGSLQIDPFGYLGIDLSEQELTIQPALPHPFKHMQIQDFHFKGARFRAVMNSTHTDLTRLPSSNTGILVDIYHARPMPLVVGSPNGRIPQRFYTIAEDETLVLANDMYWQHSATANNILQCQTTTSGSATVPGQWAGAATDGNNGTRWQPATRDPATLTVNTSEIPFQQVQQINLDWGTRPPKAARVGFTNSSAAPSLDSPLVSLVSIPDVSASQPYGDASNSSSSSSGTPELEIVPYVGNRTQYALPLDRDPVWTGRYAILEIEGCEGCSLVYSYTDEKGVFVPGIEDGLGATVGEFEVIGALGAEVGVLAARALEDGTEVLKMGLGMLESAAHHG